LDAVGYTGILRAISYASNAKKGTIEVLKNQLTFENKFETETGKAISKTRIDIVKDFINNLIQDLDGN